MISYSEFKTEQDLLLDEGFRDVIDKASKLAAAVKVKVEKGLAGLNYERRETAAMMKTFMLALKDKLKNTDVVTDDDIADAINQLKQVGKLAAVAPLFMMPGGGTTTAVLYMLGKKYFDVSILPKGLESVFESVKLSRQNVLTN